MEHSPLRRSLLLAMLAAPVMSACTPLFASTETNRYHALKKALAKLEVDAQGRIGLSLLNTASKQRFDYRADERFPFCSTFKVLVAGAVLKKSMQDNKLLKTTIHYTGDEVSASGYAPITEKYISQGMTVADLCAATLQYSDNAAANLLMKVLGGPIALTEFARDMDDHTFRLDRWEPALNTAIPDDLRDTTTPLAMTKTLKRLVLGDALGLSQRAQLTDWLQGNTTGDKRIRAGLAKEWTVGDKTGTGAYGTTNDVAVIWPVHGKPLVLSIYFTQAGKEAKPRDDVIAAATRIAIMSL